MGTMNQRNMRRLAQELVRSLMSKAQPGEFGLTVIVHATRPSSGEWPMALETTLTSRHQYRALLAEAVTSSVLADGSSLDQIAEIVAADYSFVAGKDHKP